MLLDNTITIEKVLPNHWVAFLYLYDEVRRNECNK
jgi:hypothetical protein